MTNSSLTFFCELQIDELVKLFSSRWLIDQLVRMNANLSMGIHDFSPERVKIVKKLTSAGVPVTAWLLLSPEEGYWTSLDTIHLTAKKYAEFLTWTRTNQLNWAAIGLDIEPRLDLMTRLYGDFTAQIPALIQRYFSIRKFRSLMSEAQNLIRHMQDDGFAVETYQFPTVVDERMADSTVLGRCFGIPPLDADREVLMLYTSMFNRAGEGVLWSYASQATAVGVGSTGGGISIEGVPSLKKLRWMELKRDLLIAAHHARHLYIFSLEGCVEQNLMDRLESLDWQTPQEVPVHKAQEIRLFRRVLRSVLWMLSHPVISFMIFFPPVYLLGRKKRLFIRRD